MTENTVEPDEEDESLIRDFLLGKIPEAERERIEERLLTDAAFSEMVSAIEEELIDTYTAGLLFGDERRRFETRFLVTEDRRRRVRFSEALARVRVEDLQKRISGRDAKKPGITPVSDRRQRWVEVAAAVVATLSLGTVLWMNHALGNVRAGLRAAEEQIASLQQDRERLIAQHRRQLDEVQKRLGASSPSPPAGPGPQTVVAAMLSPGALRDTESRVPSIRVSSSVLLVELRLELAEDTHPRYSVSVHDDSGTEIFRLGDLRARTTSTQVLLTLQIPARYLPQGDYSVRLWGDSQGGELEELDRYYVRIL